MNMKDKTMQLRLGMLFAVLALGVAACGGGTLSSVGGPSYPYPTATTYPTSATYYVQVEATATTAALSVTQCCPPPDTSQYLTSLTMNVPTLVSATYPTPTPPTCNSDSNTTSCAKLKVVASINDPVTHVQATGTPILYFTITSCRTDTSSQCTSGNTLDVSGFPGFAATFSSGTCPGTPVKIAITDSTSGPWSAPGGAVNATCASGAFNMPAGTSAGTFSSSTSWYAELYN